MCVCVVTQGKKTCVIYDTKQHVVATQIIFTHLIWTNFDKWIFVFFSSSLVFLVSSTRKMEYWPGNQQKGVLLYLILVQIIYILCLCVCFSWFLVNTQDSTKLREI